MVDLLVTYMEMLAPPQSMSLAAPVDGAAVARETLHLSSYVELYRAVGGPVQWDLRLRMPEAELATLLAGDATHIHVLRVDGIAAGFCEFNDVGRPAVELVHFRAGSGISGQAAGAVPARPGAARGVVASAGTGLASHRHP